MHGASNVIFMVLAGLGAFLVTIPLPKALASGNVGTSMLIIWTELACLIHFANAIRWNRNIENWAPAWCDFCGYFILFADVALVASSVAINRRLHMIATLDPRRHKKAFNAVVDILLCLGVPFASISLQYVVQQYRFYIYEDIGCLPGVGIVDLSFPLVWMLPLLVGAVSAGYAWLTMRACLRRKHGLMGETGANSAWSRRLVALGAVSTIYGLIPTSIAIALLASATPVTPWPGWTAIHSTINVIVYVPVLEWRSSYTQIISVELRRWTIATLAFVVFVFLGLTADMKRMYGAPFKSINGPVGGSRTALDSERNADGHSNDQKGNGTDEAPHSFLQQLKPHPTPRWLHFRQKSFIPFWKPRTGSQHESFHLSDRPGRDSDLEGFRLVHLVSADVKEPDYASWKLHYGSEDEYPA